MTADKTPNLQGWVFMKQFDEHKWKKKFLRIKNRFVYVCDSENEAVSRTRNYSTHLWWHFFLYAAYTLLTFTAIF